MNFPVRLTTAAAVATAATAVIGLVGCQPSFSGDRPPELAPARTATSTPTNRTWTRPPAPTQTPVPSAAPTNALLPQPPATRPVPPPTGAAPWPTYVLPPPPPPPPPPPTVANPPAPAPNPPIGSEAAEIVRLTNDERAKAGCAPLTVHPALTAAAQGHSEDMAAHSYFEHTSPSGTTPAQRAQAAGYPSPYVSENIAGGSATPAKTMQMWMSSDGHRRNILNCDTTQIGVGYATGGYYGYYWTQDFGNPGS